MIGVVAVLKVRPGSEQVFEAGFKDLAAKVKANEPGALTYQLTKSRTETGTYKVLELYTSADALKAHGQTDYFKEAGRSVFADCMAAPPEVEVLDAVE